MASPPPELSDPRVINTPPPANDPGINNSTTPTLPALETTTANTVTTPETEPTGGDTASATGADITTNKQTQTTFQTIIRSIVRDLAANDVLPPTWPIDKGFPSISESILNTGSLTQCIFGENTVVTVLLILRAKQDKLHAVNIAGPTHPQFLTFDKDEARSLIPSLKPTLTGITSLANEIDKDSNTTAKMFLQRHGLAAKGVPRVMPLPASLLHHYLPGGHPAELLIAIMNDPANTVHIRNHSTCQSLQHACLATDAEGTQSALHITANTTVECNPDIATQIISDLEGGLHDDAEPRIQALQSAKVIPAPNALDGDAQQ